MKIIYLFFVFLVSSAFVIPNYESFGRDPEIIKIEPEYLIPGEKVKIYGKNFFTSPRSANNLFINNKPVRILKSTNELIEFIIPKLPYGKAKIKFFTNYLGRKSKEVNYPSNIDEFILITFSGPEIYKLERIGVKHKETVKVNGKFDLKENLFFRIENVAIKAEIVSLNFCLFMLPSIEPGPHKIKAFYTRENLRGETFNSIFSQELILFNTVDEPTFIKIKPTQIIFETLQEASLIVELFFNSLKKVDITEYSILAVEDNHIIDLNPLTNTFKIKNPGQTKIFASFLWLPTNTKFTDEVEIIVNVPGKPEYNEVVIDEIFPFASGLFPETDANMDSYARSNDDFIEIHNLTEKKFDLTSCMFLLNEKTEPVFEFIEATFIEPFSYLAIFGHTLPASASVLEFICNEKTIDYVSYPSGKNGDPSWQRIANLSGFEKHKGTLFSPGLGPPAVAANENNISAPVLTIESISEPAGTPQWDAPTVKEVFTLPNELSFLEFIPQKINVIAVYSDGLQKDISYEAKYKMVPQNNVVKIEQGGFITPLSNGTVTIEISYEEKVIEVLVNVNVKSKVESKQLVINEILSAPNSDVNKDGIFKSDQDEFIEIVNVSGIDVDLSGLLISDNTKIRHVVPQGTILMHQEALVIFGGGSLSNFPSEIKTQSASAGSLGLNNSGQEQVTVSTSDGRIIDQTLFDNSNLSGVSLNRTPDLSFNISNPHNKFVKATGNFSPGTRIDGNPFTASPQEGHDILK